MLNKRLYYILSFTWGLPLTFIGGLFAMVLGVMGYRPQRFVWGWCFEVGRGWGAVNLGAFSFCERGTHDYIKCHEFGHSIQNCLWGCLAPFAVLLPSMVRVCIREIKSAHGKDLPPYDAVWFEGQATRWGLEYYARESVKDEQ